MILNHHKTIRSVSYIPTVLKIQGVVTTNSPVEPSATGIKVFDQQKYTLIT